MTDVAVAGKRKDVKGRRRRGKRWKETNIVCPGIGTCHSINLLAAERVTGSIHRANTRQSTLGSPTLSASLVFPSSTFLARATSLISTRPLQRFYDPGGPRSCHKHSRCIPNSVCEHVLSHPWFVQSRLEFQKEIRIFVFNNRHELAWYI